MAIRVKTTRRKVFEHEAPMRVVAVLGGELTEEGRWLDSELGGALTRILKETRFKGEFGTTLYVPLAGVQVLLVGLGKRRGHRLGDVRRAGVKVAEVAVERGVREVAVENFLAERFGKRETSRVLAEGLLLGAYRFTKYQSEAKPPRARFVIAQGYGPVVEAAAAVAEGVWLARDLVNEPPNVLNPVELARRAEKVAAEAGLEVRVLGPEEIQELGMGAYWAVAKGSANEPRFIELVYRPEDEPVRKLALVGKGLTFDTGGYSLKPPESMKTMKGDMAGAAAVIGAMKAIAALKPPVEVRAYVAAAENMISGHAYRVDDVIRAMNGKTIEVLNTDAEGRLTLADALAYASRAEPDAIVELSTLTGSCVVALGREVAGLFAADEALGREVQRAAEAAGEKVWPMPMEEAYKRKLKSKVADLANVGDRAGGAIQAALFLAEFADAPFVHLDIAGPGFAPAAEDHAFGPAGGTGFGVRTLVEWVRRQG
ncbi:leucyl aminopeptidase [Deinococcota bacterium DY0809b]